MLLLLSLFFITYSYAAEDVSLLEVVVENNSPLLKITKEKYLSGVEHWESDKVYFYNKTQDSVKSFKPNPEVINLFLAIESTNLSSIVKLDKMESTFQKHQLYPDVPNKFDLLFKSIDRFDFSEPNLFKKKILYHLKLFFYNIESKQDPSIKTSSYNDFLTSIEQCTLDTYNTKFQLQKKIMLWFNGSMTSGLGGLGIVLSTTIPNSFQIVLPIISVQLLTGYLMTATFYLQTHFAYKNFLKTIDSLKQKNSQD